MTAKRDARKQFYISGATLLFTEVIPGISVAAEGSGWVLSTRTLYRYFCIHSILAVPSVSLFPTDNIRYALIYKSLPTSCWPWGSRWGTVLVVVKIGPWAVVVVPAVVGSAVDFYFISSNHIYLKEENWHRSKSRRPCGHLFGKLMLLGLRYRGEYRS